MAKRDMSPEEKKKRWKKIAKYGGIICVSGFAFLAGNVVYNSYKDKQAEKLRLSSDRNKYYVQAFSKKSSEDVSEEFFNEMFISYDNWYNIDSDRSQEIIGKVVSLKEDLNLFVTIYDSLTYSEVECMTDFSENISLYAEFIGNVSRELWSAGDNTDISLRLFSERGDQIILYIYNGEKFMDYNFIDKDLEKRWESVRNTNNLSEYKSLKYKEIVLDKEKVIEEMEEFGTVIPYITDELIKAYNDNTPVKILFSSDEYVGYDYMSESELDAMADEIYYESISDEEDVPEDIEEVEGSEDKVENSKPLTPLSEVDLKTNEDVYLSFSDYSDYCDYVETKDLNYNSHIMLGEDDQENSLEEVYKDFNSWVCVFGNNRLFGEITHIVNTVKSSNISYQLMYYLSLVDSSSLDLSSGVEDIIGKFS